MATNAVRYLIREKKTQMIPGTIEAGGPHGMVLMDRSLLDLHTRGRISRETLLLNCNKPN